jgi:hypothetical protein
MERTHSQQPVLSWFCPWPAANIPSAAIFTETWLNKYQRRVWTRTNMGGAISYILFLGGMLGLAAGLYFGLRTAKLI